MNLVIQHCHRRSISSESSETPKAIPETRVTTHTGGAPSVAIRDDDSKMPPGLKNSQFFSKKPWDVLVEVKVFRDTVGDQQRPAHSGMEGSCVCTMRLTGLCDTASRRD